MQTHLNQILLSRRSFFYLIICSSCSHFLCCNSNVIQFVYKYFYLLKTFYFSISYRENNSRSWSRLVFISSSKVWSLYRSLYVEFYLTTLFPFLSFHLRISCKLISPRLTLFANLLISYFRLFYKAKSIYLLCFYDRSLFCSFQNLIFASCEHIFFKDGISYRRIPMA